MALREDGRNRKSAPPKGKVRHLRSVGARQNRPGNRVQGGLVRQPTPPMLPGGKASGESGSSPSHAFTIGPLTCAPALPDGLTTIPSSRTEPPRQAVPWPSHSPQRCPPGSSQRLRWRRGDGGHRLRWLDGSTVIPRGYAPSLGDGRTTRRARTAPAENVPGRCPGRPRSCGAVCTRACPIRRVEDAPRALSPADTDRNRPGSEVGPRDGFREFRLSSRGLATILVVDGLRIGTPETQARPNRPGALVPGRFCCRVTA